MSQPAEKATVLARDTRSAWRWFLCYLVGWTVLLLVPSPDEVPVLRRTVAKLPIRRDVRYMDKVVHVAGYMLLATLAIRGCGVAQRGLRPLMGVFLCGAAHGAATETLQWLTGLRHGELADWLADVVGAGCGVCVSIMIGQLRRE